MREKEGKMPSGLRSGSPEGERERGVDEDRKRMPLVEEKRRLGEAFPQFK